MSKGAVPDWEELAARLMEKAGASPAAVPALAKSLGDEFGWDAVLQAAQDKLKLNDKDFAEELSNSLYARLRSKCSPARWREIARCLITKSPGQLSRDRWESFLRFVEQEFPCISALPIARTLACCVGTEFAPRSIITFNAEPLLYALINAHAFRRWDGGPHTSPRHPFNRVLRATSYTLTGSADYVFCHGLLPVPGISRAESAIEKLVFRESEYLTLENSVFSWQASMFMSACLRTTMVFCGVSLSDPNMRRWLAWVQNNRLQELQARRRAAEGAQAETLTSTSHLWLKKKPADKLEADWLSSMVSHLGVRVIWLNSWADMGPTLELMLNL